MSFQIDENEKDRVAKEVNKALNEEYFPVQSEDGRYELELDDVFVDDNKDPVEDNPGFITEARTEGKSYELPLRGKFDLYKDGDKVDEHKGKIGPYYPKVDNLGTRIIGGKHYQNKYQVRRSPGIYPFKKNGQPRVEFNSKQGSSFNMVVDNEGDGTPTFDLQFTGQNRKSVDRGAYTMMKMFGVDENEIKDLMGDTYKYNSKNFNVGQDEEEASELDLENDAKRIYDTIVPDHKKEENDINQETASFDEVADYTKNFLEENPAFDSVVNEQTIDQDSEFFSPEVIRDSTKKLVQTFNGQHQPAHRFNEKFRTLHSLPTQMRENIIKDPVLRGQFTRKVDKGIDELAQEDPDDPSVTDAIGNIKDNLKKKIQRAYTSSDLSTTTETNNILDVDHRSREVTLKGKGGIQSEHAIQPETIELHPSRIGMTDIVNTQKSNPGVTVPIANGASVGEEGDIERRLYDREKGEVRSVNSAEVDSGNVGFPDEFDIKKDDDGNILSMEPKNDEIMAGVGDDVETTSEDNVRYVVPQMSDMFSDSTNFVPFLNHNSGPRTIMGARQMGQAVSLEDPDTPAVDTVNSDGKSFSKKLGEKFVPTSDVAGTVSRVTNDAIYVEDENGNEEQHTIFNDMPLNRGGYVNHQPEVEEGDEVSEGDVLAENNYTDEEGKLAIGKNLRTAYMPFNGFNYEDAMVMSESGAQKLKSNHMYEKVLEVRENDRMGLDAYDSYLSDRGNDLDNSARQKLDQNGMIREGETVEKGDILMAGVGVADMRNEPGKNEQLSQMFENIGLDDEDRSVYWDKPFKGEVTKVKDTDKEKRVYVKSKEPMKEGDKISARDGGKGIVSKIVPDNKMPQTEDGRVPDVLVDPHGVPSRANPGQIFELAAGKLAKKKGEPYEIENFDSRKDWEELKEKLDEENIDVKEDLYDPQTGRKIPDVAMGHKYQAKLVHKLDKKFAARGTNEGYDMDRQPTGGASMDNLTVHSMIGHNARANMAEMSNLKGTKNDDYWTDLANNMFTNRKAEVPYSFQKFQGMMESLGVNINRDSNDQLEVMPLTDEEIEDQSAGPVQSAQAYNTYRQPGSRGRNALDPFDKGLFDPNLVGESGQNRNHIELPEPVPNPTFTKGIQQTIERGLPASLDETPRIHKADGRDRPVRDVAQKDIEDIYKGDASIEVDGKKYKGGEDLKEVLSMVDTEKTEEVIREKAENYMEGGDFQEQTASDYKTALRYFTNLNDNDINPEDAFVNEKIPVMRAEYRQPLVTSDGEIHNQPVNKLYAATIKGAGALKQAKDNVLPEETIKKRREGLLHDIGALYGGAGYEPRGDFKARSIMDQLAGGGASAGTQYYKSGDDDGKGPKTGYVQKKVMKKQQEPSGRSTIVPSGLKKYKSTDALGIDEVGMPEEMAWKTFEPWVRKRLARELGSAGDAADEFEERTTRARQMLEEEARRRPVMLNRAPSWWPYNVTAHDPKIIEEDDDTENTEKAIRIPNMVVAPYQGGDFDGDTMSLHVPAEQEAIAEAESLKPSRNLRAPGSKKLMAHPDHSQLMGLHDLSLTAGDHPLAKGDEEVKEYQDVASVKDLVEKYNNDEVPVHQKVRIRDSKGEKDVWTPGWAMVDQSVRAGSKNNFGVEDVLDKMKTDHPGSDGSLESTTFDDTTLNDKFMESLMKHHPDEYADVAHQLSMAGAKHATNMGFTTGFDDIKPEDDLAQRYYDGAEEKVEEMAQQVAEENGRDEPNKADRKEAMVNVFMSPKYELNGSEYKGAIQAMEDEIESRPGHNAMTRMMQVGSRGSSGQIRQLLGTVGLPKDVQKDFINEPIKSSLNRGLKGGEYFLEQHGTIKGLRDRAVETSKPGYLGKQIIASSQHQIITEKDCGTDNGVEIPLHNDDDRLNTQELNGRIPVGEKEPMSGERLSAMEREGVETVEVRSPLTCEAERGLCQKCYGMTANGNVPEIGDNVGVRSGQSLLEASTKMTLKSFHSTGEVDKTEPSFERFQELVQLKTPQIKASIAKGEPGEKFEVKEVNDINAQGEQIGTEVKYESKDSGNVTSTQINNQHEIRDKVEPGNEFESGERFTRTGNYDIEELRSARGIEDAQDYLTNQLHNIFGEIGGINRRAAETAVRSMSDFGTIVEPGASDYAPGQKVRVGKVRAFNDKQDSEEDKINMKPQLHSMNKVPQLGDNWLAKLNFEDLKKHIRSAGIEGQGAEIHGTSPVSSYMYGAELDQGDEEWQY